MYLHSEQYDSALFHANMALSYFPNEHTCMLAKAQSFSLLGIKDSAVVYAGQVMDFSSSMKEKYNALFVLAYDNPDISYDEMCELTQLRADIGALLENQSTSMTSAIIQIIQDKDNPHKFPVLVLWVLVACIALLTLFAIIRRHIIHKNILTYNLLKRQNKIIAKTNNVLSEQNEQLKQQQIIHNEAQMRQLENTCTTIRQCQDIKTQLCWNDYGQMCRVINKQFSLLADRLGQIDGIHETDIRLCVLVLIGFSLETIADILPCSPNSVKTLKRRTALKLGTNSRDLRMFLLKMAANMPV